MTNVSVKSNAKVWMDTERSSHLPDALARLNSSSFQPLHDFQAPGKFQRGKYTYWITFDLENNTEDSLAIICQATGLAGDSAWIFDGKKKIKAIAVNDPPVPDSSGIFHTRFWSTFVFRLPAGAKYSLLIKIRKPNLDRNFSPSVSDASVFEAWYYNEVKGTSLAHLILLGMLSAILLFSFFQYINTRDKAVLWYCLYGLSVLVVGWRNFEDFNYHYFSTLQVVSWKTLKALQAAAIFITYANFIRFFFDDKLAIFKKISFTILCICIVSVAADLVLMNIDDYVSWVVYFWFRMVASLIGLFAIFMVWRIPHPLGKYILVGSLCLVVVEIISWFFPTMYAAEIGLLGVALEFLIFSYAMGLRIRLEFQEKSALKFANELLLSEKELETERLRTRIAQDIHDEVGSSLTKISLAAQVAARLPNLDEAEMKNRLEKLGADARSAAGQLREIVFAINPDFDRFEEMQSYFRESAREFWRETSVEPHFDFDADSSFANPLVPPDVKRQLLLIFKEAQNNTAKHAGASKVWLTLRLTSPERYLLEVQDNGKGFSISYTRAFSNGLSGIKRRAESIGAALSVHSEQGKGTKISVEGALQTQH